MFKVIIVDDEAWVVKDLRALVNWNALGFEIVAEASNGADAEMLIKQHKPDLVLCDIRMPGMSGLDLIAKIQKKYVNTLTVFISAYSDFSNAQQAIGLGSFDYILKPVELGKFEKMLERVHTKLSELKKESRELRVFNNSKLIYELLDNTVDIKSLKSKFNKSGYLFKNNKFRVLIVKSNENEFDASSMDLEEIFSQFKEIQHLEAILGYRKWMVLLNFSEMSFGCVKKILKKINGFINLNAISIGVSSIFTNIEGFKKAFNESDIMVNQDFFTGKPGIYFNKFGEIDWMEGIVKKIKNTYDPVELTRLIKSLPDEINKHTVNIDGITRIYNHANICISRVRGEKTEPDFLSEYELLSSFGCFQSMLKELLKQLETSNVMKVEKSVSNNIVKEILSEINRNYGSKIELNLLAEKYYINSNYLSQLFKQETGKAFTNYLIEFRMNKAVELLKNDDMPLNQVSEKIGYEDYVQFSKMFKKYIGITPSSFQRNKISNISTSKSNLIPF